MFLLSKNEYSSTGKCWYKDEFGNSAFLKKEEKGFVAKLRFHNTDVKMEKLVITIPLSEDVNGANLTTNVIPDVINNDNSLKTGVNNFTLLIQHWIDMCYKLLTLNTITRLSSCPEEDESFVKIRYEELMDDLSKCEELHDTIVGILNA